MLQYRKWPCNIQIKRTYRKITLFCKKLELYKSGTAPQDIDNIKVKEVEVEDSGNDEDD